MIDLNHTWDMDIYFSYADAGQTIKFILDNELQSTFFSEAFNLTFKVKMFWPYSLKIVVFLMKTVTRALEKARK